MPFPQISLWPHKHVPFRCRRRFGSESRLGFGAFRELARVYQACGSARPRESVNETLQDLLLSTQLTATSR